MYCVALNVPLVDVDDENGPLEWFVGHDRPGPDTEPERFTAPAGTVLLRDTRVWHRGSPNVGHGPRPMLALLYTRGWYRFPLARPTIDRRVYERLPDPGARLFRGAGLTPMQRPTGDGPRLGPNAARAPGNSRISRGPAPSRLPSSPAPSPDRRAGEEAGGDRSPASLAFTCSSISTTRARLSSTPSTSGQRAGPPSRPGRGKERKRREQFKRVTPSTRVGRRGNGALGMRPRSTPGRSATDAGTGRRDRALTPHQVSSRSWHATGPASRRSGA